ncbi:OCIA domain-containing protein 1-like [Galleria mellonella]|uniref:OCIA domain-containing protein 1-like n=1 Tax=Galleria mellonella TaxID=7137 RepID=A0A6J1X1B6_GALME|nr:OCIA domain-containing protein 1-like [Galleria mellonella]
MSNLSFHDDWLMQFDVMNGKDKKVEKKDGVDCKCYAESHTTKACPPIRNVTHPLRYYEFTQDEIKALEQCDKESFYQRCLPFSTLFATVTYAAIKFGCLKRNSHFGVYPKLLMAAWMGYLYGRISYTAECDAKLRQLPASSHLGNVMRKYHIECDPSPGHKK